MEVHVYRNLQRDCWSVRGCWTGCVIGHASAIVLKDARLVVKERSQQRAVRRARRIAIRWVRGTLVSVDEPVAVQPESSVGVVDRLFDAGRFTVLETGMPLEYTPCAVLLAGKLYVPRSVGANHV